MGRPPVDPSLVASRRGAVADICDEGARRIIDLVVEEARAATSLMGFGADATRHYGDAIMRTLPTATDAIREMDDAERSRKIASLAGAVRAVSEAHHIPRIIERGLTSIAIRLGRQTMRREAQHTPFTADELEAELVAFGDAFEEVLFHL